MDHTEALFADIEEGEDILLGLFRDGNHSISHLKSGLLNPEAEVITTSKLFALPGSERLEGVNRNDEGNTVVELRHDTAKVGVPRVAVDKVSTDPGAVEIDTPT